jgi:hypothetical protein
MSIHTLRRSPRLALAATIGGMLAAGALAGPALAASDGADGSALTVRKAGGEQQELTVRKAGGEQPDGYIIGVL